MSKITKALEKAARERLQRQQEQAVVTTAAAVAVPVTTPDHGAGASVAQLDIDPHIVSATDPKSPVAEQYRILRMNLQSAWTRPGPKTIVVTSAVHNEGKSVTALNLALTFARQEHLRVVLVDADLRKGSLHTWAGLGDRHEGLSTRLSDGAQVDGALVRLQEPPLALLPAGPSVDQPAELLESLRMRRLLADLKSQFDLILLDTPPVLLVADPSIVASQADGVLLIVQADRTQRKTVERAYTLLTQAKAKVLGCVLTHVEYYLPGYYRYYHYARYQAEQHPQRPPTDAETQLQPASAS